MKGSWQEEGGSWQLAVGKGMRERKSEKAMERWGELKGANLQN